MDKQELFRLADIKRRRLGYSEEDSKRLHGILLEMVLYEMKGN